MDYLTVFILGGAFGGVLTILLILFLKACVYIGFMRRSIESDILDDSLIGAIIDHEKYIISRDHYFRRFFK